jgi:hypothetical protein
LTVAGRPVPASRGVELRTSDASRVTGEVRMRAETGDPRPRVASTERQRSSPTSVAASTREIEGAAGGIRRVRPAGAFLGHMMACEGPPSRRADLEGVCDRKLIQDSPECTQQGRRQTVLVIRSERRNESDVHGASVFRPPGQGHRKRGQPQREGVQSTFPCTDLREILGKCQIPAVCAIG